MKVFVVAEGVHKIQFVRRQEMLEQIRGIFLQHSNDEVNLYLTPACELSQEEMNYISGDRRYFGGNPLHTTH